MTDETQTPAVPLAAANGDEEAGQPAPVTTEDAPPRTATGYLVTCRFCGARHQYPAAEIEPVLEPEA